MTFGAGDPGATGDLFGLLIDTQRRIEALYALEAQPPVTSFLIPPEVARGLPGGGSRTLVSQDGDGISVGVVLDSAVVEPLQQADPRRHLDRANLGPFCTLVEEVSHFAFLLFCAQAARSATELELELQGEVDKYLSVVFLMSLQNEGAVSPRLKELLFREYHLAEGLSPERAQRYHDASGLAYRYCGYLESQYLRPARLFELRREARRFYRLGQSGKIERIQAAGRA
jgi:hypothetical protein